MTYIKISEKTKIFRGIENESRNINTSVAIIVQAKYIYSSYKIHAYDDLKKKGIAGKFRETEFFSRSGNCKCHGIVREF